MLNLCDIFTLNDLADANPEVLCNQILGTMEGKKIFQREVDIRSKIAMAKALIKNKPIPIGLDLEPFRLVKGDVIFDMEYVSDRSSPVIFSISAGYVQDDGEITIENRFIKDSNDVEALVVKFYEDLDKNQAKRLIAYALKSADLVQLKKILPPPQHIELVDIYYPITNQVAFPTLSTRLKNITECIFEKEERSGIYIREGLEAVYQYKFYLKNQDETLKKKIIEYNNRDVELTIRLIKWFNEFCLQTQDFF